MFEIAAGVVLGMLVLAGLVVVGGMLLFLLALIYGILLEEVDSLRK